MLLNRFSFRGIAALISIAQKPDLPFSCLFSLKRPLDVHIGLGLFNRRGQALNDDRILQRAVVDFRKAQTAARDQHVVVINE